MQITELHTWDVSPAEARAIQTDLASRVSLQDAISLPEIATVAGVDNTYLTRNGATMAGAVVVVLSYPSLEVIETAIA
jgi:deoxyribonuclease V